MANIGAGLGGFVQGVGQGLQLYRAVKGDQRQAELDKNLQGFYKEWGDYLRSRNQAGAQASAPAAPADVADVPAAPLVTVPQPAPAPMATQPVGYGPMPGTGVGLGTQPLVPMVTRSPKTAVKPPFTSGLGY